MEELSIYKNLCPNCEGEISSARLELGTLCDRCIADVSKSPCSVIRSGRFFKICTLWEKLKVFEETFKEKIGAEPWAIQRTWAIRFFNSRSFAMLAPTGIGKTTFGLTLAFYIAKQGGKVYLIFPTEMLIHQTCERLKEFGLREGVVFYSSSLNASLKKVVKEKIKREEFEILITTTSFLYKNVDLIPKGIFDLIFVDDVDSLLKTARSIDKIFMLMGLTSEEVEYVLKNFYVKRDSSYKEKIDKIRSSIKGTLIVSTATSKPKSKRIFLLRELLGFEVGNSSLDIRNVVEVYKYTEEPLGEIVNIVREFGSGGLVFLPSVFSRRLNECRDILRNAGIRAEVYTKKGAIELLRKDECDILIGLSTYNNPLARGIDLPEKIRYAIFAGVPRMEFPLNVENSPSALLTLMKILLPPLTKEGVIKREEFREIQRKMQLLIRYKRSNYHQYPESLRKVAIELKNRAIEFLKHKEVRKFIERAEDVPLRMLGDEVVLIVPDVTGYIQASGRTSRLFMDRLTKGLVCMLVDDRKAFNALLKRLKWMQEEVEFKEMKEVNLEEVFEEIERDRKRVFERDGEKKTWKTSLVVVESPNKARTIAHFFGKPSRRSVEGVDVYEMPLLNQHLMVVATRGHLFDIATQGGYYGIVHKGDRFVPVFEFIDDRRAVTAHVLREMSLEADEVIIATDPDTEGEKIAYDVCLVVKPYNNNVKRTEFHEVTRRAFIEAVKAKREININLVKAQLLRRIADRWVGFKVSEFVQKVLKMAKLSAGRVQTPVLNWIVERYEALKEKVYVVKLEFKGIPVEFEFQEKKEGKAFMHSLREVEVIELEKKEDYRKVLPFNTPSLLRDAASILKYSPQKTMELAQSLFEAGLITYHRTDSIRVSQAGINVASVYIKEHFGEEYFAPASYSEAGGAHECIRPTRPMDAEIVSEEMLFNMPSIKKEHLRLYDLIFRRFIASQMKSAKLEQTTFKVSANGKETTVEFTTAILEDGNNLIVPVKVYTIPPGKHEVESKNLIKKSREVPYTFSSLIQRMKDKGIGRPSTYAVTVEKLFDRKYVVEKKGSLFPTKLGKRVNFILKNDPKYSHFIDENFTKELEQKMDMVENNGSLYTKYLKELYTAIIQR